MKTFSLLISAALISSPAFAVENEAAPPAPAAAAAEPAPAPAPVEPPQAATESKPEHRAAPTAVEAPTSHAHEKVEAREKLQAREKTHAASKPEAKDKEQKKPESAQKPTLTKPAYARLLAAEIRRHTPKSSDNRTGSIHVSFTVGASGRVVSHKVRDASNPALEPVVGRILASVHTPPPPGGTFSAIQEFNFR